MGNRLALGAPFGATLFGGLVVPREPVEHRQQSGNQYHEHKSSPVVVMGVLTVRSMQVGFERRQNDRATSESAPLRVPNRFPRSP